MSERQRFNLHLPGLLKVLAEHLYSSKKVGVRELIQNSHDSCVRRRVEGGADDYEPRIDVALDRKARTLTIADNGMGLIASEITDYLATIGRGYTRELRERLSLASAAEAGELIGQFGLGFLSAFLLASEVTLLTRSAQGGSGYRWHSGGDEFYDMVPAWREETGTTVTLRLKSAAEFLLQEKSLIETVRQYADFLPIPIHVNNEELPVNLLAPPWEAEHPERAIKDYIARSFRTEALWVMPLQDRSLDLGHDSITVPMKGFLFVPPGSVASVREHGDLTVYIRRMFICERERDLLPSWARFVRGMIDSPLLQPTASRESIHQDENFDLVRQSLEEQLGEGLRALTEEDPTAWRQIVRGHSDVIMSWAARDDDFFRRVEDVLLVRTSRGPLSMKEYLDLSGGTIYFVTQNLGSLQEKVLAEGHDVPAIEAAWVAVLPFLEKYAERHDEVKLVQLDGQSDQLLRSVKEEKFARLLEWYEAHDIKARAVAFKPAEAPAIILYPAGAELAREAQESAEANDLPGPLAGLVHDYIEQRFSGGADLRGTLYLNASCPLIRQLAERPPDAAALGCVLTLLHQLARLFAGRMLSAADAVEAFAATTQAIAGLVKS